MIQVRHREPNHVRSPVRFSRSCNIRKSAAQEDFSDTWMLESGEKRSQKCNQEAFGLRKWETDWHSSEQV